MTAELNENDLVRQVRRQVPREALVPRPVVYWCDFTGTILIAHAATIAVQFLLQLESGRSSWVSLMGIGGLTLVSVVGSFRGLMFVHEVAHRNEPSFRSFRIVWNALAGIPFLVPSFFYDPHREHHRATAYGTAADGEYLPARLRSRTGMLVFVASSVFIPAMLFARFLMLTPVSLMAPPIRRIVWSRASTLIVNAEWNRGPQSDAWRVPVLVMELLCFGWCVVLVSAPFVWALNAALWAGHLYVLGAALALLNAVRTLGAHRWSGTGGGFTFEEQTMDSVNVESRRPWEIALNPVGLRFHALHHLMPAAPYHALPAIHLLLLQRLPAESGYRALGVPSVWTAIVRMWRGAGDRRRAGDARCDTEIPASLQERLDK